MYILHINATVLQKISQGGSLHEVNPISFQLSTQMGSQVVGWDLEWNMNFNTGRLRYGGMQMFMRLGTGAHAKYQGRVVVLCHDTAFRYNIVQDNYIFNQGLYIGALGKHI